MLKSGVKLTILSFILMFSTIISMGIVGYAQNNNGQSKNGKNVRLVTIPVTVDVDNARSREIADKLQPEDFLVREDKQKQQIITVKSPSETPVILSVLIQDDLVLHVGNEIKGIREFVQKLPAGSQVMIGYISSGALRVTQEFTGDRALATEAIRLPFSSSAASPYSPYVELLDAVYRFDGQSNGRRMILLISDGLDLSQGFRGGSPSYSLYLERAIKEAQRRSIAVYSFYAPSTGLTSRSRLATMYGQSSLSRLADETGGEAFFSGRDFVSFDGYFKELNELMANQWLITYRSANSRNGFHRVEVTTDFDLHLHYPAGYSAK